MESSERSRLFEAYFAVDDTAGLGDWKAALGTGARLIAMINARQTALTGWLAQESSSPEKDFADATRSEPGEGTRAVKRAETMAAVPAFAKAHGSGDISVKHVDALARGLQRIKKELRQELLNDAPRLALLAGSTTPREFDKIVQEQVRRLETDGGEDRLSRQRRATALKSWVDQQTGMWRLSGSFDPVAASPSTDVYAMPQQRCSATAPQRIVRRIPSPSRTFSAPTR